MRRKFIGFDGTVWEACNEIQASACINNGLKEIFEEEKPKVEEKKPEPIVEEVKEVVPEAKKRTRRPKKAEG